MLLFYSFVYLFIYVLSKDSIICCVYKVPRDETKSERKSASVWKVATVAYFEIPSQYLPGGIKETLDKPH